MTKYAKWARAVCFGCLPPLIGACQAGARQDIGTPLNLDQIEMTLIYRNDFSGSDYVEFERNFTSDNARSQAPDRAAQWIAEGAGGAEVCNGKLWVAPVPFQACGIPSKLNDTENSNMVVWHKTAYPADILMEFTVNHHASRNGLTLVFLSATGMQGENVFDLSLPVREAVFRRYNRGLSNYSVSYWSRNQDAASLGKGERYSNRIRRNPGANLIATDKSQTDTCSDCDYRIRILKIGGTITVEINGIVVNQAIDDSLPYKGGHIGLRSMKGISKVSYDNFKVWAVD